jgi:hypothetical protein
VLPGSSPCPCFAGSSTRGNHPFVNLEFSLFASARLLKLSLRKILFAGPSRLLFCNLIHFRRNYARFFIRSCSSQLLDSPFVLFWAALLPALKVEARHRLRALGDDNLFHGDRYKWNLRFTVINLTDKYALYNFLSTFSGTHYVTPRTYTAQLGFTF